MKLARLRYDVKDISNSCRADHGRLERTSRRTVGHPPKGWAQDECARVRVGFASLSNNSKEEIIEMPMTAEQIEPRIDKLSARIRSSTKTLSATEIT